MKNRIIIMAAAIAALAVSCQKEEIPTPVIKTEPMVIATGVDTKTILVNQKDIYWTPGDKIMVLDDLGNKSEFSDENLTENSTSANFAGEVTDGTTKFMAVYPSNCVTGNSTYAETVVTIPDVQTPKVGSFATGHNISVAYGEKTPGTPNVGNVVFENIGGLLKFSLPTELTNIASVSISSSSYIAGSVEVSPTEDGVSTTFTGNVNTITMNPGSGKTFTFEDGKVNTFWFALAPVSLNDITISVSTDKGYTYSMRKTWDKPLVIEAGKFRNLGTLVMKQAVVVAQHTYNDKDQLNGTKLNITLPDDAKDILLNLKNKQGDVWTNIRSLEVKGADSYTSYPYLPQGTYQLSGTYTIKSNGTEVQLGTTIVTVPAPTFEGETTVSAVTSYSLAKGGDKTNANSYDASMIGAISATCSAISSISSDVLAQVPVSYVISLDNTAIASGTTTEATVSPGDKASQALGEHPLNATFTFDNVQLTAKSTAVITGLPYSAIPSKDGGWTTNMELYQEYAAGINWNNLGRVSIYPDITIPLINLDITPEIYSPKFYSPGDFYMSLSIVSDLEIKGKKKDNYSEAVLICSIGDEILIERHGDKALCSPNSYLTWKTATESNVVSTKSHKLSKGETNFTIYNNAKVNGTPLVYISNVSVMY